MRLGIDASNLRAGGGVTHLVELLRAAEPLAHGFSQVVVWAPDATLAQLPGKQWLTRERVALLNRTLPFRLYWQRRLSEAAAERSCDILFVPGGSYAGTFRPFVTMFRNMLPFSPTERRRYGASWRAAKLALLKRGQAATFRRADGIIVLTEQARDVLQGAIGTLAAPVTRIAHGVDPAFRRCPRPQHRLDVYSPEHPFKLLYVSTVDEYKHQWIVAESVCRLARSGLPIQLDLIGSAYPPALRRLRRVLANIDPTAKVVRYHGGVAYPKLPDWYHRADAFIFASTCENMPNILLEAMAAGLPIACSDRAPMPDLLGDGGVYFDPESAGSVVQAVGRLIEDAALRERLAQRAHERSGEFTWARCADRTLAFIHDVASADRAGARPRGA